MKQISIKPTIYQFKTFKEFLEEFEINENDIVISSGFIIKNYVDIIKAKMFDLDNYGEGEPTDLIINKLLADCNKINYKRIVAIGGGTAIDIAKFVALSNGCEDVNEMYDNKDNLVKYHELIAIPTTCGTGSEVTGVAVANRTKINTKQGLASPTLIPEYAVLIPELLKFLPYKVFATSSIDALIHSIESYLCPIATPYTDIFAIESIKLILNAYKKIALNKDSYKDYAEELLRAANYAGISFGNASCGTIHAMSYAFGGKYHVAHGESNYQFLIPVMNYYKKVNPEGKIKDIENVINDILDGNGFAGLAQLLENILHHKPMSEYGAVQDDIKEFAESTVNNQQRLLSKGYVEMSLEAVQDLYQECL